MNASIITESVVGLLRARYGSSRQAIRSPALTFGSSFTCSINYSKLLGGHRFFFGISGAMADPATDFGPTAHGDYCLLICGSIDTVIVLPRRIVTEMLTDVPSRRIDVHHENGMYVLQTTRHPKLNVSEYLNAYPAATPMKERSEDVGDQLDLASRDHVRIQHSLIVLGKAEGCAIWVPTNDRNLAFQRQSFSSLTLGRLPNFGFDENTRRIVQNIDVLWLQGNVIRKAFEIESTTSIYSGLLRMNDLALAQPNNQIELFIVAAKRRKQRVFEQLIRPTFQPLINSCRFVAFEEIDEATSRVNTLNLGGNARVSGLIEGEKFTLPDNMVYPSQT